MSEYKGSEVRLCKVCETPLGSVGEVHESCQLSPHDLSMLAMLVEFRLEQPITVVDGKEDPDSAYLNRYYTRLHKKLKGAS